jgi:hypothetical protein
MEFYVNHSSQEIARIPTTEWEEDDDIERVIVDVNDKEEMTVMISLIDDYNYDINKEDREVFMKDIDLERLMAKQYDEMVKQEDDDGKSVDSWGGWDEPGASFDY